MASSNAAGSGGGTLQPEAAGAGTAPPQVGEITKSPRRKPNTLSVRGGRRVMKGYPVTGDELWSLGLVQGGSALAFALAGSAGGFWLSTKQALDLAGSDVGITAQRAAWQAYGNVAFYSAIALAILGIVLFGVSGIRAHRIVRGTVHD